MDSDPIDEDSKLCVWIEENLSMQHQRFVFASKMWDGYLRWRFHARLEDILKSTQCDDQATASTRFFLQTTDPSASVIDKAKFRPFRARHSGGCHAGVRHACREGCFPKVYDRGSGFHNDRERLPSVCVQAHLRERLLRCSETPGAAFPPMDNREPEDTLAADLVIGDDDGQ